MEFVIDKYEYKNNNKYPHIGYTKTCISTKLCLKDDIIEDLDKLEQENNKYLIQKLEGTFKTTQLNRLEELKINIKNKHGLHHNTYTTNCISWNR